MTTYRVEGMTCQGCVASVTRALERIGAKAVVSLEAHTATVEGQPDEAKVKAAIEGAGFDFGGRLPEPPVA